MTLEELEGLVQSARWFEHLGQALKDERFVCIPDLRPWADLPAVNNEYEEIADQMEWLPSSNEQGDPIHGTLLEDRAARDGKKKEYSRQRFDIYKKTLISLRRFVGHPLLKVGPHDFTEAARGAALYASRHAAYEIQMGEYGFWCTAMKLYEQGHWPCGILKNGIVVVL